MGIHTTFRFHFADEPEHCNWNEVCLRPTVTHPRFFDRKNTTIISWEVCNY